MKPTPIHLRHEYEIACHTQEDIDDETECYQIALVAIGLIVGRYGRMDSERSLIKGWAVVKKNKGFWFEERRPVQYPPGMNETEAILVLSAVFEDLKRGALYHPDFVCTVPINLNRWLVEKLGWTLATHIETVLRTAVNINNAIASN